LLALENNLTIPEQHVKRKKPQGGNTMKFMTKTLLVAALMVGVGSKIAYREGPGPIPPPSAKSVVS